MGKNFISISLGDSLSKERQLFDVKEINIITFSCCAMSVILLTNLSLIGSVFSSARRAFL